LKVCSAADIGRKITPETLRHIEEEETNAANGNSKDEWKHDFESSGKDNIIFICNQKFMLFFID
jgi:hypothetical protein